MQEQGKYKIGEYTFQTFHEYRDGQEDVLQDRMYQQRIKYTGSRGGSASLQ